MSPYEPKSADPNEAISTNLNNNDLSHNTDASENAEMVFRLPDLEQIKAESKPVSSAATESYADPHQSSRPQSLESEQWDTEMSDAKFLRTNTSLPGKSRRGKILAVSGLLLAATIAGLGVTLIMAKFYDSVPECANPAPDAPEAPAWQAPQYALDKSPSQESTSTPVDLTAPSISLEIPGSDNVATKDTASEFAPPAFSGSQPSQVATNPSAVTATAYAPTATGAIPTGPNMTSSPVFAATSATPATTATPTAQPANADRFSPDKIQAVLNAQQNSAQAAQYPNSAQAAQYPTAQYPQAQPYQQQAQPYPQTQPGMPTTSTTGYPQTQVPTVAQNPSYHQPQYPTAGSLSSPPVSPYPSQTSPASVPVSPYPSTAQNYTQNRVSQGYNNQNWPSRQTAMTPSTTAQPPTYPSTNYPSTGYPTTGYPTTGTNVPSTASPYAYPQSVYR